MRSPRTKPDRCGWCDTTGGDLKSVLLEVTPRKTLVISLCSSHRRRLKDCLQQTRGKLAREFLKSLMEGAS